MSQRTVPLELVPAGLVVDRHEIGGAGITVHAHSASPTSECPSCGLASPSVHSRYGRCLGDLPTHGRRLRIRLSARRFRYRNAACKRRVFTERFAPDLTHPAPRSRAESHPIGADRFSKAVGAGPTKRIVLLLGNAGFHTPPNPAVADGTRLVYLPPYSPELQPAETL